MAKARTWFTADTHFGADSQDIIMREMRPFADIADYTREQVRIWNEQATANDIIYVLGDFCNYNEYEKDFRTGLAVSARVKAHIILVTGTAEERVIKAHFENDFDRFRAYCLNDPEFRFDDVRRNAWAVIGGERFFLTHRPADHDRQCLTFFGHTHRGSGLWKPFGFNVGTDLNHFRLFGERDILYLLKQKKEYWDHDPDMLCY